MPASAAVTGLRVRLALVAPARLVPLCVHASVKGPVPPGVSLKVAGCPAQRTRLVKAPLTVVGWFTSSVAQLVAALQAPVMVTQEMPASAAVAGLVGKVAVVGAAGGGSLVGEGPGAAGRRAEGRRVSGATNQAGQGAAHRRRLVHIQRGAVGGGVAGAGE